MVQTVCSFLASSWARFSFFVALRLYLFSAFGVSKSPHHSLLPLFLTLRTTSCSFICINSRCAISTRVSPSFTRIGHLDLHGRRARKSSAQQESSSSGRNFASPFPRVWFFEFHSIDLVLSVWPHFPLPSSSQPYTNPLLLVLLHVTHQKPRRN